MDQQEDYLAHYGTRGMKWGVHNAETAARYRRAGKTSKVGDFMSSPKGKAVLGAAVLTTAAVGLTVTGAGPAAVKAGSLAVGQMVAAAGGVSSASIATEFAKGAAAQAGRSVAGYASNHVTSGQAKKVLSTISKSPTKAAVDAGKKQLDKMLVKAGNKKGE